MKKKSAILFSLLVVFSSLVSCVNDITPENGEQPHFNYFQHQHEAPRETVVVANRGGSSISFIDAVSNTLISTLTIPDSEPMYVVYVHRYNKIYVGDRRNNKIHIIDATSKEVEGAIEVGRGVFHMWADGFGKELWVTNDIDNTISVIDLSSNTVTNTIDLEIKPHDIFLTWNAKKAYVSVINPDVTLPDSIYSFSTRNYEKTHAQAVGKDPHLFHIAAVNRLYVPCISGGLYTLNGNDLDEVSRIDLPGAHGIFSSLNPFRYYVTNITGSEVYGLETFDEDDITTISTPEAIPHNIVVNFFGTKMFVTHSGALADKVTVYNLDRDDIVYETTVTVGLNPFGIAYYCEKE